MLLWLKRWKTVLCSSQIGKNWNAFPGRQAKLAALLSHGSDSSSSWLLLLLLPLDAKTFTLRGFFGLFALPAFQSIDLIVFCRSRFFFFFC